MPAVSSIEGREPYQAMDTLFGAQVMAAKERFSSSCSMAATSASSSARNDSSSIPDSSRASWMRRSKVRQSSTSLRSPAAVLLTFCAVCGSFQKSGALICFSSSESWVSFDGKSKTLQKLVGQFPGLL